jgi:lysophospholipase
MRELGIVVPVVKTGPSEAVFEARGSPAMTPAQTIEDLSRRLVVTPDNPIPDTGTVLTVATADGLVLRAARWDPWGAVRRGTVTILQGRAEFIEKYFETVDELRSRGFTVVAFDWRGQGGSSREVGNPRKGHVRDFADYRRDLEAIREQVLEPLTAPPHFALAHSMGGAIALDAAADGWFPFDRLVALTPMLALCIVRRTRLARQSARVMNLFGWGGNFVPGGGERSISTKPFPGNRLTSDARRYARNAAVATALGPGAIGDPSVSWVDAAYRHMAKLAESRVPLRIRIPTLVIGAGADPVCSTPAIELFSARLKAGHAIVLPGAKHEILMERDILREDFWAAFDAFIPGTRDRIGSRRPVQESERLRVQPSVAGGYD